MQKPESLMQAVAWPVSIAWECAVRGPSAMPPGCQKDMRRSTYSHRLQPLREQRQKASLMAHGAACLQLWLALPCRGLPLAEALRPFRRLLAGRAMSGKRPLCRRGRSPRRCLARAAPGVSSAFLPVPIRCCGHRIWAAACCNPRFPLSGATAASTA